MADEFNSQDAEALNKALAQSQSEANNLSLTLAKALQTYKAMGSSAKTINDTKKALIKTEKELLQKEYDKLKTLKESYSINNKIYSEELKKLNSIVKINALLKEEKQIFQDLVKLGQKQEELFGQQQQNLRNTGKELKKLQADWKQYWHEFGKDPNAQMGRSKGHIAVAAGEVAGTGGADLLKSLGPWGVIAKLIIEAKDNADKYAASLQSAAAASGHFADGMAKYKAEGSALAGRQAELMAQWGMTTDEALEAITTLRKTGIETFGEYNNKLGLELKTGFTDMTEGAIAFSKATNESIAVIAERFATLRRNFGEAGKEIQVYGNVLNAANKVAQMGITTTEKYMQTVFSLGEAFTDVGMNINGVNNLVYSVAKSLKNMKFPADQLQKVAQGILNVSKAGEGWQVFMAKMSGVQGGYVNSLFTAQQRGAGGLMPEEGKYDPMKAFNMMKGALFTPTAGLTGGNRQLMIERLGKQYGMDERTTQVFQKLSRGGISGAGAFKEIEKLKEQAKANNISAKGMFDIIKGILTGMIAKPLFMILNFLARRWGGSQEDRQTSEDFLSKLNEKKSHGYRTQAIGGVANTSGFAEIMQGETITPPTMARMSPLKNGNQQASNINVNLSLNIDTKQIDKSFDDAKKFVIKEIYKQQQRNFGRGM